MDLHIAETCKVDPTTVKSYCIPNSYYYHNGAVVPITITNKYAYICAYDACCHLIKEFVLL